MKNAFTILSLFFTLQLYAQSSGGNGETRAERNAEFNERPLKDRMAYGGELSLSFGNYTYINISPFVGYRINPDITVGLGPSYQYIGLRNSGYLVYSDHIYGGRVFLRHELGRMFLLHGEYEILNLTDYITGYGIGRLNAHMAALGLGYKSSFGDFAYYYIMLLYDFIQDPHTPYPYSPIVLKAGFIFGK